MKTKFLRFAIVCAVGASFGDAAGAAELPKSMQNIIKTLKLEGKPFLKGLDEEASNTPSQIVEAAKKERELIISSTCRTAEFGKMMAPFRERYPFLKVQCNFGNNFTRAVKPLIAFKEGRVITDIVEGPGGQTSAYVNAKAVVKIDDLPNFTNVEPAMRDSAGYHVGLRLQYWCMSYNTNKVKKSQLPATWDDLLTAKSLYNGRIGLGDSHNGFLIQLWGVKGPEWTKAFMDKLFNVVKPQLRREGPTALAGLVASGEVDIGLPTIGYRVHRFAKKGAPISFHCPEPVPYTFQTAFALNGPHKNAAKLYLNWRLSKEGQIAAYYALGTPPAHKGLQDPSFLSFPDQVLGKKTAPRTEELIEKEMAKLGALWKVHWEGSEGGKRK